MLFGWILRAVKKIVISTYGAASDEDIVKMATFQFQWII